MSKTPSHAAISKRAHRTLFAAGALIAAVAATTLTACGPRDETALGGGADAVAMQPARAGQAFPAAPPQTQLAAAAGGPVYAPAQPVPPASPTYRAEPPPRAEPAPAVRPA